MYIHVSCFTIVTFQTENVMVELFKKLELVGCVKSLAEKVRIFKFRNKFKFKNLLSTCAGT